MGLLDRFRSRRDDDEPERSLADLRRRGRWLHVQHLDGRVRDSRKEPNLQVAWWWHRGERTVVVGRGVVVTVLRPAGIEGRLLRFLEPASVVTIGLGYPPPGEVARTRGVGVALDPHDGMGAFGSPPADAVVPAALTGWIGQAVQLQVRGGRLASDHGLLHRLPTDGLPAPDGRLDAAVSDGHHVVVVLADGTVAVVPEPCQATVEGDGTVVLAGDIGRVVLDLPSGEVQAARAAELVIRAQARA